MSNVPSRTPLLLGVGVVLAAMIGLNYMAQQNNPEIQKKVAEEKAAKAAEEQAKKQASNSEPTSVTESGPENDLVTFGEEKVLGKPDGREVVIGWRWTPEVQANPKKVYEAIEKIQKTAPAVRLRVVNIDVKPSVPAGISINGSVIVPLAPDGTLPSDNSVIKEISMN